MNRQERIQQEVWEAIGQDIDAEKVMEVAAAVLLAGRMDLFENETDSEDDGRTGRKLTNRGQGVDR